MIDEEETSQEVNEKETVVSQEDSMVSQDLVKSTTDLEISGKAAIDVKDINLWYGQIQALYDISIPFKENAVTALIGPSGCGKSTLLRALNRMNDLIPICRTEGEINYGSINVLDGDTDLVELRKKIGMVFQKPNPFPKSVYENVGYGVQLHYKPTLHCTYYSD